MVCEGNWTSQDMAADKAGGLFNGTSEMTWRAHEPLMHMGWLTEAPLDTEGKKWAVQTWDRQGNVPPTTPEWLTCRYHDTSRAGARTRARTHIHKRTHNNKVHARARTHTYTHTHARTQTHTHAHTETHRQIDTHNTWNPCGASGSVFLTGVKAVWMCDSSSVGPVRLTGR